MCILFWTVNNHPRYKLIFAGNRDEFLGRPTQPAHVWPLSSQQQQQQGDDKQQQQQQQPQVKVIGGTDLEAATENGSWLAMTTDGRLAALTNYRELHYEGSRSRGELVRDFLLLDNSVTHKVDEYMTHLQHTQDEYGGYSLICFDLLRQDMVYFSNRDKECHVQPLSSGTIYGLSNSVLSHPWAKVKQGQQILASLIKDDKGDVSEEIWIQRLFDLLSSSQPLSGTNDVHQVMTEFQERIFIPKLSHEELGQGKIYGTRTSSVILVDHQDNVTFVERDWFVFDKQGNGYVDEPTTRQFKFKLNDHQCIFSS